MAQMTYPHFTANEFVMVVELLVVCQLFIRSLVFDNISDFTNVEVFGKIQVESKSVKSSCNYFIVFDNIYLRFAGLPSIIHLLTRFVALLLWLRDFFVPTLEKNITKGCGQLDVDL